MSFFDSLDRNKLKERLGIRAADGSLMRLIGKCLHVGVLDGDTIVEPEWGTTQGSVLTLPTEVAKQLPIEFSTSILRSQLRPHYGDGFLGAPLQANALSSSPPPSEQGESRGPSRTPTIPDTGDSRHV